LYNERKMKFSFYPSNTLLRLLGRRKYKWDDNIKKHLQEVGYEGMDWINLAQDRNRWRVLAVAVMVFRVP
jgi:hypothetical protein